MIYDHARQLIGVFFLIAVVNLLVIPESYKKIITFYMHFFIIIIILNPIIRIMDNEVGSFMNSINFINEEDFEKSIRNYQEMIDEDLEAYTFAEMDARILEAADICQVRITNTRWEDVLVIHMVETSERDQLCMVLELGLNREDVKFERGGR